MNFGDSVVHSITVNGKTIDFLVRETKQLENIRWYMWRNSIGAFCFGYLLGSKSYRRYAKMNSSKLPSGGFMNLLLRTMTAGVVGYFGYKITNEYYDWQAINAMMEILQEKKKYLSLKENKVDDDSSYVRNSDEERQLFGEERKYAKAVWHRLCPPGSMTFWIPAFAVDSRIWDDWSTNATGTRKYTSTPDTVPGAGRYQKYKVKINEDESFKRRAEAIRKTSNLKENRNKNQDLLDEESSHDSDYD